MFDLKLLPSSHATHDARDTHGRYVQIKLTQINSISIYEKPDWLIVLKLEKKGAGCDVRVVYNGDGAAAWVQCGKLQKNGQRRVSLSKLEKLQSGGYAQATKKY